MEITQVFAIAVSIILTSVIIHVVLMIKRRNRLKQGSVSNKSNKNIKRGGKGIYNGIEYYYSYFSKKKNSPSSLVISINIPSNFSFKVRRESGFDRFFKKLNIAVEISTLDQMFDEKFYITTNTPKIVENLFRNSQCRDAVNNIYEGGYKNISYNGQIFTASKLLGNNTQPVSEKEIENIVSYMSGLIEKIRGTYETYGDTPDNIWKIKRITAFAIPISLEIAGVLMLLGSFIFYKPLDVWSLILTALPIGIFGLFLYIPIAGLLLKGRSTSHSELLIAIILTITGFMLSGISGKMFLNGYLDKSRPETYNMLIEDKYFDKDDDDYDFYVITRSWREGRDSETIEVSGEEYDMVIPDTSRIYITTKDGRYGYEWISDYVIKP